MDEQASQSVGCVVLAAGQGLRFGAPKQLAELGGRPLLDLVLKTASTAPVGRVVVVLGAGASEILDRLDLRGAEPVICDAWRGGMAESLKSGVAALGDVEAAAVLLGDQPLISPAAIERLISERGAGRVAVRATYGGHPGHPVVLERSLFQSIVELRGDAGARNLLERADVAGVPCEDVADPLDVDSPADLRLAEVKLGPVGLGRGLDESAPSSG